MHDKLNLNLFMYMKSKKYRYEEFEKQAITILLCYIILLIYSDDASTRSYTCKRIR